MEICERNHVRIVHDEYDCPFCESVKENENLSMKVDDLEAEVITLKDENETLAKRVDELEAE